jgi:hypothetical protein
MLPDSELITVVLSLLALVVRRFRTVEVVEDSEKLLRPS